MDITKFQGIPGANLIQGAGGNTGSGGDTYADIVSPNGSAQAQFSDEIENIYTEAGTVVKVQASAGTTLQAYRWDRPAYSSVAVQLAGIVFTGLPTGGTADFFQSRGTQQNARLRMKSNGLVGVGNLTNSSSATVDSEFDASTLWNVPLVLDAVFTRGTASNNGRLAFRARRLDDLGGTPLVDYDVSTNDVGTADMTSLRLLGSHTGSINMAPYYLMMMSAERGATEFLPDPEPLPEPLAGHRFYWDGTQIRQTARFYWDGAQVVPVN